MCTWVRLLFPKLLRRFYSVKAFALHLLQRLKLVKEWIDMYLGDFLICVKYIKCCSCPSDCQSRRQYINSLGTRVLYEMSPVGLVCKVFLNLNVLLLPRLFWREGFDFGFKGEVLRQCCLFLHTWKPWYKEGLKPSPELVFSVPRPSLLWIKTSLEIAVLYSGEWVLLQLLSVKCNVSDVGLLLFSVCVSHP